MNMKSVQRSVGAWGNETFGVGNKEAIVNHLRKEVEELAESHSPEEAADCLLLLLQHAHNCGYDLLDAAVKKHRVNVKRDWGEPDEEGVCEHVEEVKEDE